MTRIVFKRCTHCGTPYEYCASAYGEIPNNPGHPSYCNDCLQVVQEALSHVPRRFTQVWEPTNEVSLDDLLLAEKAEARQPVEGFLPQARRVSMPLFKIDSGQTDSSGYVRLNGHYYHYRFWPGEEKQATITVQMLKNLQTGELRHDP